jgi:large subunit ribosomal protein L25
MTENTSFAAENRERIGKGGARTLRRAGRVPAVIYGKDQEPLSISIDGKELSRKVKESGFFSHVYEIAVGGKKHRVFARDLQRDPVSDQPIHVDFMSFSAETRVNVDVDVVFENEELAPGLKKGGVLNVVSHSIELICSPDEIPENLKVDLTGLEIGDSIHINSLVVPESAELAVADPDTTIATIAAPTVAAADEEEEAEEGAVEEEAAAEEKEGGEE